MYFDGEKTINKMLLDKVNPYVDVYFRILASGGLGYVAWLDVSYLPLLIVFGFLVVYTRSALSSWLAAVAYYLVSSSELPVAFSIYFPEQNPLYGYLYWMLSGALLGLPWLLVRRLADIPFFARLHDLRFALLTFLGLVISLAPPFGLIHWVHPGLSAGMMFPGWGVWALILSFLIIAFFPLVALHLKKGWLFISIVAGVALLFSYNNNAYNSEGPLIPNVYAVKTDKGEFSPLDGYERIMDVRSISQKAIPFKVPIVLFPEVFVGVMRPSIGALLSPLDADMKDAGVTTLVGADVPVSEGVYDNSLVGFGATEGVVYRARVPMPLNAFPWLDSRQRMHFTENPVVEVAGQNVFFSICYESYLLEHAVEAMLFGAKPDMMLASSNLWAIKDLRLARIQSLSIQMMARIMGIPVKWSYNR